MVPSSNQGLIRQRIERNIDQGRRFLGAVSRFGDIREALEKMGYSETEHQLGWMLLFLVMGWQPPWQAPTLPPETPQKKAIRELTRWVEAYLPLAKLALAGKYPEYGRYLFERVKYEGRHTVVAVIVALLSEVRILREGTRPNREAVGETERAAIALLEERGILGPEIEARLQALADQAMELAPPTPPGTVLSEEAYLDYVEQFQKWLREWRKIARLCITDRRHLIRLGLARRRSTYKPKKRT